MLDPRIPSELNPRTGHAGGFLREDCRREHGHVEISWPMTNLETAVDLAWMECLDELVARKRAIADEHDEALRVLSGFAPVFQVIVGRKRALPFRFHGCELCRRSGAESINFSTARQSGARTFWKPLDPQAPYAKCLLHELIITDAVWSQVVTLPCSTKLTREQQAQVIDSVHAVIGEDTR